MAIDMSYTFGHTMPRSDSIGSRTSTDMNAAKNILKVGTLTCGLDTVRPSIHIDGGVV